MPASRRMSRIRRLTLDSARVGARSGFSVFSQSVTGFCCSSATAVTSATDSRERNDPTLTVCHRAGQCRDSPPGAGVERGSESPRMSISQSRPPSPGDLALFHFRARQLPSDSPARISGFSRFGCCLRTMAGDKLICTGGADSTSAGNGFQGEHTCSVSARWKW